MKREKLAPLPAYTNPRTHPPEDFLETGLPMPPNNLQTLPVKKQYNRQEMVKPLPSIADTGQLAVEDTGAAWLFLWLPFVAPRARCDDRAAIGHRTAGAYGRAMQA